MSNLEQAPQETECGGEHVEGPTHETLTGREVVLGGVRGIPVSRTLPNKDRRMVGAWCFVDYYGPVSTADTPMTVPPHPHCGLQTVSWLIAGEVSHRDSLGNVQLVQPGQLSLMTAGHGISHAELTPGEPSPTLHGVQLWVALPGQARDTAPAFEHHAELPTVTVPGATITVVLGELAGATSPARCFSPLVGAEIHVSGAATLPLNPRFEHAALMLTGSSEVDGVPLEVGPLLYLGAGRTSLDLRTDSSARVLLLGGEPFGEEIVMWWNFVARDHAEIVQAQQDWTAGQRFGSVEGSGERLAAPALPTTPLKPRGRHR